jgi:hypothetical protein
MTAAGRVDGVGNLLRRSGRCALIDQGGDEVGDAGLLRRLLHRSGADQQPVAHRRLLALRNEQDLQAVGERLQLIGGKIDLPRLERRWRRFARPLLRLGGRSRRQHRGECDRQDQRACSHRPPPPPPAAARGMIVSNIRDSGVK